MTGHMINPLEGNGADRRDGLGEGKTYQQGTDQAGALGHGDETDISQVDPGPVEGLGDNGMDRLQVSARGEFRDHAAKGAMDQVLAAQNAAVQNPAVFQYGGGGIVAGALNS